MLLNKQECTCIQVGQWLTHMQPVADFPDGLVVKTLPAVQETQETRVRTLGWEDSLEKRMATYSSILAWRIPWAGEPGGL